MAGSASFLWIAAGLFGLVTVAPAIDEVLAEPGTVRAADGLVVPRAPDGQFYFEARAGNVAVRFLVDNGIDDVVLAGEDAAKLGLNDGGSGEVSSLTLGNRGVSRVSVRVGRDVPVSLIGRSFLVRTAGAQFERDRMVLR